jgi:Cu/Zn superoxide dismutase
MRKLIVGSVVALLALAGAGQVSAQTGLSQATLNEQNGSGESGTAVISDEFDLGTRVVVDLQNAPKGIQPIHIHLGTCDNIAPKPSFPLQNVVNGHSETLLPVAFAEIDKGVYLINVHTSPTRLEPYVACGAIQ